MLVWKIFFLFNGVIFRFHVSFRGSRFQKLRTLTSSRRQIRWWMNRSVACRPTGCALPFYFRCALALGAWPTCFSKQRIQAKMWICLSCILDRLQEQPARSKPYLNRQQRFLILGFCGCWIHKRWRFAPGRPVLQVRPWIKICQSQSPQRKKYVGKSDGGFSSG